jgi:hypothetical protein
MISNLLMMSSENAHRSENPYDKCFKCLNADNVKESMLISRDILSC